MPAASACRTLDHRAFGGGLQMRRTALAKIAIRAIVWTAALSGCATQEDLDALRQEVQQAAAQAAGAQATADQALQAARA